LNKAIQILVELLIVGLTSLFGAFVVFGVGSAEITKSLGNETVIIAPFLLTGAFLVGFVVNALSGTALEPLHRWAERSWLADKPKHPLSLEEIRNEIYATGNPEIGGRLTYHRAMTRIAGSIGVAGLLLAVIALVKEKPTPAVLFGLLALAGVFAVRSSVIKSADIALKTWEAINRHKPEAKQGVSAIHPSLARLEDGVSVRALIFAGGTAFRNCNIALARRGHRVTRIVPSWDNGGSSRMLRDEFDVLSIGDIRQALMTMAHGENISNEVIRLFNCRLSEDGDADELCAEMESFLQQEHPRMAKVPGDLRNVILKYLETFWHKRPVSLDLHNGSIGNLVMLGAYLAHGNDMNTAIYVFRQLCGINGNVWPITLENDLQLCAQLENGETIVGEENVTDVRRPEVTSRLEKPLLTRDTESRELAAVTANSLVLSAFANVDVIVLGPGSFFSSVLPHLMVAGVADELAKANTPKIFVGNMREGNECYGWSVTELVNLFLNICHEFASEKRDSKSYLTHIIAHDSTTHSRNVKGDRYLETGDLDRFRNDGIQITVADLEDPWKRGAHDANVLAQHIIDAGR
jgi:CofD-related protein of GAK system